MKISKLLCQLQVHRHSTPVVSQYWSFNTRRMIYQCECGRKEIKFVTESFGRPFPISTCNFLSNEDFEKILYNPNPLPEIITFEDRMKYITE